MFAVEPGLAGPALVALGQRLPRPKAVLVVSPHWMTRGSRVSTAVAPKTIHDFGGFPKALYSLSYPAPGAPELAQKAIGALKAAGWPAEAEAEWGLDHGAWVPLTYLFPDADVPVFQVSLPAHLDGGQAYAYGEALAPMADEGVLIIGSGSLTHNLYEIQREGAGVEPYAAEFAAWIAQTLHAHDHQSLKRTMALAPHAPRAHPTAEHLWPLMVAAGAAGEAAPVATVYGGFTHGVLAMDAFLFG